MAVPPPETAAFAVQPNRQTVPSPKEQMEMTTYALAALALQQGCVVCIQCQKLGHYTEQHKEKTAPANPHPNSRTYQGRFSL